YFDRLVAKGMIYPCHCTRADVLATQAPHESDGRVAYKGTCRPAAAPPFLFNSAEKGARRLYVPDEEITFSDLVYGPQSVNLARHCGDFVVRRADGAWAYQLAVVIDDALMGVTEVIRGNDLLLSAAQQIHLFRLFGFQSPRFGHLPLLCNAAGQRLSKRDSSLSMEHLRQRFTPADVIGRIAWLAHLVPNPSPLLPVELLKRFSLSSIPKANIITEL
ncbi:MAG: tRNA glutamyl-Q(34) synthetase GluQRS, partial [Muribaculaceae bacterium]|nr:tRNA glutamyl-Q(34) synthetase GluQRS [Muribaculaceae bacterium]